MESPVRLRSYTEFLALDVYYVVTKLTLTLTQSGLLAVLLEHQRRKVIQLARRRAQREHLRAVFWSALTRPFRALTARTRLDDSAEPLVRTVPRHT
jgi:heme exporter protein D